MPESSKTQADLYRQDASLVEARTYIQKGWNPTPLIPGRKNARLLDWQRTRIDASNVEEHIQPGDPLGLVLGKLSNGLIDVDLDCSEAVHAGQLLLSATELRHGRASRPESHRFYVCEPLPDTDRITRSDPLGGMILEVRGTGHQTMVPPSVHPSGEPLVWHQFGEPARVERDAFLEQVDRTAAVALLARHWPGPGNHHDTTLALSGGLARAGWSEEEVVAFVVAVCTVAGDTHELNDRITAARSTVTAHEAGQHTTGWQRLREEYFDPKVVAKVREWLGLESFPDDDRPRIQVTAGNLDKVTQRAWDALAAANDPPTLFRRSNRPVRVERIDDSDKVIVQTLNDTLLRFHLANAINWWQMQKSGPAATKPPIDVARNMLANPDIPLPVLNRVVTVPVFSPSGVLQTEPGYHPEARVYYEPPAGLEIPDVPQEPTAAELGRARSLFLDELLIDFPFVGEADRAHAVAPALLPFVRDMVDGPTPLHLFEAAKPGTGKGLLARVVTTISTGGSGADETPLPTEEEETRKKLLSLLMEGVPFIYFDNINAKVNSASLASALTSMVFRDRKLGVSETPHIPVRCGWLATANNPVMSNEMARRTVRCRLVAEVENPHMRSGFRHGDLVRYLQQNRGEFVWAALTLVRAWIAKGKPEGKTVLGTYENWSKVLGGVLDVAGIGGFLSNTEDFYATVDDEGAAWRQFVRTWWDQLGPDRQTTTTLLSLAVDAGIPFDSPWEDRRKEELGKLLRQQRDNIYAGFALRKTNPPRGASSAYRLEPKEGQTWTPPTPEPLGSWELVTVEEPSSNGGSVPGLGGA